MKTTEAQMLLTIAAAFDNRKPDPDAAKAWAMALDDLRFEDCREVVVQHYRTSREWMMPADVVSGVKRLRAQRIIAFGPYDVPSGLTGAEYAAFVGDMNRRIGDGELTPTDVPKEAPPQLRPHRSVIAELGTVRTVDEALAAPITEARRAMLAGRAKAQAARKPEPALLLAPEDISREPEPAKAAGPTEPERTVVEVEESHV